jgi:glyceraldehyde 3-phosphate dehydrogenase
MQLPYKDLSVEMVLECTGVFLTRAKLQPYFDMGVKKVGSHSLCP